MTSETLITLREFTERNLLYLRELETERWKAHAQEHALVAQALEKQELVQGIRNAAQNEWRSTLNDQQGRFASREYVDTQVQAGSIGRAALDNRIAKLEGENIRMGAVNEERARQSTRNQWLIGVVFTIISLAFAVLSHFIR